MCGVYLTDASKKKKLRSPTKRRRSRRTEPSDIFTISWRDKLNSIPLKCVWVFPLSLSPTHHLTPYQRRWLYWVTYTTTRDALLEEDKWRVCVWEGSQSFDAPFPDHVFSSSLELAGSLHDGHEQGYIMWSLPKKMLSMRNCVGVEFQCISSSADQLFFLG